MSFKPKERFGIDTNNDFAVFDISEAYKIDPEDFFRWDAPHRSRGVRYSADVC